MKAISPKVEIRKSYSHSVLFVVKQLFNNKSGFLFFYLGSMTVPAAKPIDNEDFLIKSC